MLNRDERASGQPEKSQDSTAEVSRSYVRCDWRKVLPTTLDAPDKDSSADKTGIGTSYNVTANASISYASSKYVDAANWKW